MLRGLGERDNRAINHVNTPTDQNHRYPFRANTQDEHEANIQDEHGRKRKKKGAGARGNEGNEGKRVRKCEQSC